MIQKPIWILIATAWAVVWLVMGIYFVGLMEQTNSLPASSLNGTIEFGLEFIGLCVSLGIAGAGAGDLAKQSR